MSRFVLMEATESESRSSSSAQPHASSSSQRVPQRQVAEQDLEATRRRDERRKRSAAMLEDATTSKANPSSHPQQRNTRRRLASDQPGHSSAHGNAPMQDTEELSYEIDHKHDNPLSPSRSRSAQQGASSSSSSDGSSRTVAAVAGQNSPILTPPYDPNETLNATASRLQGYSFQQLCSELEVVAQFLGKNTFPNPEEDLLPHQHPESKAFEVVQRVFPGPINFSVAATNRVHNYHSQRLLILLIQLLNKDEFNMSQNTPEVRNWCMAVQLLSYVSRIRAILTSWTMSTSPLCRPEYFVPIAMEQLQMQATYTQDGPSDTDALQYVLRQCYERGLCHREDLLFEPVLSSTNERLPVFRPPTDFKTVSEFIARLMPTGFDPATKLLTRSASTIPNVAKLIENSRYYECPLYEPNRHVFAFRNGLYDVSEDRFYAYGSQPRGMVACKYHDFVMPWDEIGELRGDWEEKEPAFRNIDTPLLKIFETQFPEPSQQVIVATCLAFMGRMLFDQNSSDSWQKFLCIIGKSNTGKSTLLEFMQSLYDESDSTVISNNVEKVFGMANHYNKLITFIEEISEVCHLPKDDFLSMVSNGLMEIKRKGKTSIQFRWKSPVFAVGNRFGAWSNTAGEVTRRALVVFFDRFAVTDKTLRPNVFRSVAKSLVRMVREYKAFVAFVGDRPVDQVLDPYFAEINNKIALQLNSLEAFFQSEHVRYPSTPEDHPKVFCRQESFVKVYQQYCSNKGLGRGVPVDGEQWNYACDRHRVITKRDTFRSWPRHPFPGGDPVSTVHMFGCDLRGRDCMDDAVEMRQPEHSRSFDFKYDCVSASFLLDHQQDNAREENFGPEEFFRGWNRYVRPEQLHFGVGGRNMRVLQFQNCSEDELRAFYHKAMGSKEAVLRDLPDRERQIVEENLRLLGNTPEVLGRV